MHNYAYFINVLCTYNRINIFSPLYPWVTDGIQLEIASDNK